MKDKRVLVLVSIIVIIVGFIGTFIYQRVIFSYSLTDLMNKLDGYWVNVDENDECEIVIFKDDKFIRGPVNTEPSEYAYVIDKEKIEYNNYDLTINMVDINGNEELEEINIDLNDINEGIITFKIKKYDDRYSEYEYISDNEDDVWDYCNN